MLVTITQRGGFVGGEVTLVQLDTTQLDPDVRREVERQVVAAGAMAAQSEPPIGADLLEYTLRVDDGRRLDAITWVDDGGPSAAPVRDLVARLQQLM